MIDVVSGAHLHFVIEGFALGSVGSPVVIAGGVVKAQSAVQLTFWQSVLAASRRTSPNKGVGGDAEDNLGGGGRYD